MDSAQSSAPGRWRTGADWAASELALAHELGNAVTQAYARSDMLDQRRGLMERWGQHLMTRQIEDA